MAWIHALVTRFFIRNFFNSSYYTLISYYYNITEVHINCFTFIIFKKKLLTSFGSFWSSELHSFWPRFFSGSFLGSVTKMNGYTMLWRRWKFTLFIVGHNFCGTAVDEDSFNEEMVDDEETFTGAVVETDVLDWPGQLGGSQPQRYRPRIFFLSQ